MKVKYLYFVFKKQNNIIKNAMKQIPGWQALAINSYAFSLNAGYLLAKIFEGENDGLVSVESVKWGDFLGLIETDSNGISHGDVIDL